jgi:anti-anti-sigma factor
MNLTTDHQDDIAIVRVKDARIMYPQLAEFSGAVKGLIDGGHRKVLVDLTPVGYVDSATIGCFMDLYHHMATAGGRLKLSGVQRRVETMLTMTGAHNFIDVHENEAAAIQGFGGPHADD